MALRLRPNLIWIDEALQMRQAEIGLELLTDSLGDAATHLACSGVTRCDAIGSLPGGFKGGWIISSVSTTPICFVSPVHEIFDAFLDPLARLLVRRCFVGGRLAGGAQPGACQVLSYVCTACGFAWRGLAWRGSA